jgi:hypothetical protein
MSYEHAYTERLAKRSGSAQMSYCMIYFQNQDICISSVVSWDMGPSSQVSARSVAELRYGLLMKSPCVRLCMANGL